MATPKITLTTPMQAINQAIDKEIKRVHQLTIRALSMLGEQTVNYARSRSALASWFDQSGNLRSSIGYVVVHNGEKVSLRGFEGKGKEGVLEGRALAEYLAEQSTAKYALIVVAGMHYAEYVERMKGKDVLASPELFARNLLPTILAQLEQQINRGRK